MNDRYGEQLPRRSVCWVALVGALCSVLVAACQAERELARYTSPDGFVDAVDVIYEGGAPTVTSYELYVVPAGASIAQAKPVITYKKAYNVEIQWCRTGLLEIRFERALIHQFRNFVDVQLADGERYEVDVRLLQVGAAEKKEQLRSCGEQSGKKPTE